MCSIFIYIFIYLKWCLRLPLLSSLHVNRFCSTALCLPRPTWSVCSRFLPVKRTLLFLPDTDIIVLNYYKHLTRVPPNMRWIRTIFEIWRKNFFSSSRETSPLDGRHHNSEAALSAQPETREEIPDARLTCGSMLDGVAPHRDFIVSVQQIPPPFNQFVVDIGLYFSLPICPPLRFVSPCYMVFPLWVQLC